jgi:hypothetical protein
MTYEPCVLRSSFFFLVPRPFTPPFAALGLDKLEVGYWIHLNGHPILQISIS